MIYESTITYAKPDEKGGTKNVKESYIVDNQDLFSQVETFMYEEFAGHGNFDVLAIKRTNIKEIANQRTDDKDLVWQAEMQDTFVDDDGNEKYTKYKVIFFSKSYETANAFISEYAKQGYCMKLVSLKLTKYMDIL